MTISQIILGQLMDPFRIILLGGLIYTMLRTRAATGTWLPLASGIVFVAILIPSTTSSQNGIAFTQQLWTGIISNAIIAGIMLGLYEGFKRLRAK